MLLPLPALPLALVRLADLPAVAGVPNPCRYAMFLICTGVSAVGSAAEVSARGGVRVVREVDAIGGAVESSGVSSSSRRGAWRMQLDQSQQSRD